MTPSSRSEGGYRLYGDEALDRSAFMARARQLGCSLDEVADLLVATPPGDERCSDGCACLASEESADAVVVGFGRTEGDEVPIACTLQPWLMPGRIADWQHVLSFASGRSRTTDDRVRIEFAADVDVVALVRLVEAEQQCCSFFAFAVTIDERGIALEVGAPADAHDIVETVFGVPT